MRTEILQSPFGGDALGRIYGGASAGANDNTADWDSRSVSQVDNSKVVWNLLTAVRESVYDLMVWLLLDARGWDQISWTADFLQYVVQLAKGIWMLSEGRKEGLWSGHCAPDMEAKLQ